MPSCCRPSRASPPNTAATLLGELGALARFTEKRALVAYGGFYPVIPRVASARRHAACRAMPSISWPNVLRRHPEWRTVYLRKRAQGKKAK